MEEKERLQGSSRKNRECKCRGGKKLGEKEACAATVESVDGRNVEMRGEREVSAKKGHSGLSLPDKGCAVD